MLELAQTPPGLTIVSSGANMSYQIYQNHKGKLARVVYCPGVEKASSDYQAAVDLAENLAEIVREQYVILDKNKRIIYVTGIVNAV